MRLLVPPHHTYSLALQLPVLSGLTFKSSLATLLDGVQRLLDQKALGRSSCTSQTALRHLWDLGLEVSSEFLRIVGIVKLAETPLATPEQRFCSEDGGHPFQGSHKKSVVGAGKLCTPKNRTVLDESPSDRPRVNG